MFTLDQIQHLPEQVQTVLKTLSAQMEIPTQYVTQKKAHMTKLREKHLTESEASRVKHEPVHQELITVIDGINTTIRTIYKTDDQIRNVPTSKNTVPVTDDTVPYKTIAKKRYEVYRDFTSTKQTAYEDWYKSLSSYFEEDDSYSSIWGHPIETNGISEPTQTCIQTYLSSRCSNADGLKPFELHSTRVGVYNTNYSNTTVENIARIYADYTPHYVINEPDVSQTYSEFSYTPKTYDEASVDDLALGSKALQYCAQECLDLYNAVYPKIEYFKDYRTALKQYHTGYLAFNKTIAEQKRTNREALIELFAVRDQEVKTNWMDLTTNDGDTKLLATTVYIKPAYTEYLNTFAYPTETTSYSYIRGKDTPRTTAPTLTKSKIFNKQQWIQKKLTAKFSE